MEQGQFNAESSGELAFEGALINGTSEGILIADDSGTLIYANPAAEVMFAAKANLVGRCVDQLIPGPQRKHHSSLRGAYASNPSHRRMGSGRELHALRLDGTVFPVEISLTPLTIGATRLTAAMVIDISERRALENQVHRLNKLLEQQVVDRTRELNRSQLLYRTVARNYPNGTIFVLDEHLQYEFAEGKELFTWNLTSDDLKGSSYLDQLPDAIRTQVEQRLRGVLAGANVEFEVEHHGASYRLNAVSVQVDVNESPRILVVEQNITEAKLALEKERHLNELKTRFVSMASHEFRTPLSTISSSAELAQVHLNRGNEDRVVAHLEKIRGAVNHLVSILDDYLSLERFETRNWEEMREAVVVPEVLQLTLKRFEGALKRGQHVDAVWPVTPWTAEWSYAEALQGIVSNLVSNAIKYSEEETTIRLSLGLNEGHWTLRVEDQGVGIDPAEQAVVFTRFYRCERTDHIPGTGVGLDLVQQYVHLLQGQIHLQSTLGAGTCITIRWPQSPIQLAN